MKKLISVFLTAVIMLSFCTMGFAGDSADDGSKGLEFRNGKFTILHITDPQDDMYMAYDLSNFLKLAIETSKPDLIVFTGDIVEDKRGADKGVDDQDTREGVSVYIDDDDDKGIVYDKTLENVRKATDNIFSIINSYNIPFVTAQGNNDYACGVKNEDWLKIYSEYGNCITRDESKGTDRIDCHVEIKGKDGKTAFNIWMMDSGTSSVSGDSIKWYKETSSRLKEANDGKTVPSFVFQHIYVKEIGNLFERCHLWDDGVLVKNLGAYRLNREVATGHYTELTETPGRQSEEFRAWQKQGDVIGAYFGHEHYGGYTGKYKGIELGLTYGCEFAKSGPYGFRVITLSEDDISDYTNDIYVYTGSVKTNDAKVSLQQDESYPAYETRDEMLAQYWENFKVNFVNMIKELFD